MYTLKRVFARASSHQHALRTLTVIIDGNNGAGSLLFAVANEFQMGIRVGIHISYGALNRWGRQATRTCERTQNAKSTNRRALEEMSRAMRSCMLCFFATA